MYRNFIRAGIAIVVVVVLAGCGTVAPSKAPFLTAGEWTEDLDFLQDQLWANHPDPYSKTSESTWKKRIAELKQTLPSMSEANGKAQIIKLVALLDSHSGVSPEEIGFHMYGFWLHEFSDGTYVLNATDQSLIGAKLLSIGSTAASKVLERLVPFVNADNESGLRGLRPWFTISVEVLHSLGIVSDIKHAAYKFRLLDGSTKVVNPAVLTLDGYLPLENDPTPLTAPAAWENLATPVSDRVESNAFIISYSIFGADATNVISDLNTSLAEGTISKVIFDMRYCGGGDFNATSNLRVALSDPRIPEGGLYVLIGPGDESAATALASTLDRTTAAKFVGEPTPARADPFLDPTAFTLPNSKIIVHVPTSLFPLAGPPNTKDALRPDIPVESTGIEFFQGRDPALAAAIAAP